MPYIHVINATPELTNKLNIECCEKFSKITGAPVENIHFIYHTSFIDSEEDMIYVKIEWLPRTLEHEKQVKELLQPFFYANGYTKSAIYFTNLNPDSYHFDTV